MAVKSCGSGASGTAATAAAAATATAGCRFVAGAAGPCVTTAPLGVMAAAATDFCKEFSEAKATIRDSWGGVVLQEKQKQLKPNCIAFGQ